MRYLGEPSVGIVDKLKNILFVFVLFAIYLFGYIGLKGFLQEEGLMMYFGALVLAPLIEEIVFRVAPIGLVKDKPDLILPTIILSSALFGWLHNGAMSWPIQGVLGFMLSLVYLKNNYSYWSVVFLHFLWNLYCQTILDKL